MIATALTEMFGLQHPIVLAPMGGVSGGHLAATVRFDPSCCSHFRKADVHRGFSVLEWSPWLPYRRRRSSMSAPPKSFNNRKISRNAFGRPVPGMDRWNRQPRAARRERQQLRIQSRGARLGDFANPAALLLAAMPVRLGRGRPVRRRARRAFIQSLSPETLALARSPGSAARCAADRRRS
jgi:hypothetical protein